MRRVFTALLIATFLTVGTSTAHAATNGRYHAHCAGPRVRWLRASLGVAVIEHRVFTKLIPCVYHRWGPPRSVSLSTVKCIANRESHGYPYARNPSGASGIFQIIDWQTRARFWLRHRWFPGHHLTPSWSFILGPMGWTDARANTIMAIRMMDAFGLGDWGGGC